MPNSGKYPWQWLWDSAFHAIIWSGLGDPRAVKELETLFALELPSGFIPHMGYQTDPSGSLRQWHVPGRSDITQPPMYGHALRVLHDRGFKVDHLYEPATRGLNYLFEHRRDPVSGLIRVVHPWETGTDDSPRWDGALDVPFSKPAWDVKKAELTHSLQLSDGVAVGNPGFDVGSAGFSALVAFNARELATLTGDGALMAKANALADAIDAQWIDDKKTWGDVVIAGPKSSATVRTLDALLPVLVSGNQAHVDAAFAEVFNPASFARPFGPSSTAADEPSYEPDNYWRGNGWPPLTYLLSVAADRRGRTRDAARLARALVRDAEISGFGEYNNPENGTNRGATPQGWTMLALEGAMALRPLHRLRQSVIRHMPHRGPATGGLV